MCPAGAGGGVSGPIGILGGIFDPVHNGHLAVAMLAKDYFSLASVLFIPAGIPPHKVETVAASPDDRLTMLHLALDGVPSAEIWEQEVHHTGISYTIDTLEQIRRHYPDSPLYFIVGADNLTEIRTWHRYKDILDSVTLCVTERPGYSMEVPESLGNTDIKTFPSPCWGVSSRQLRRYLYLGYSCRHLVPEAVLEYVNKRELYRHPADAPRNSTTMCR
jgi:nicotinate-nucleotide adenylyltransferase